MSSFSFATAPTLTMAFPWNDLISVYQCHSFDFYLPFLVTSSIVLDPVSVSSYDPWLSRSHHPILKSE